MAAKLTINDHNLIVNTCTAANSRSLYPKQSRLRGPSNSLEQLKAIVKKYWWNSCGMKDFKGDGTLGKIRGFYIKHDTEDLRDKFLAEIQAVLYAGELEPVETPQGTTYYEDQNGGKREDDGTYTYKTVTLKDEKPQLFSGISNTTLLIAGLVIIGIIVFFKK
jgi:hypothetical protein